LVVVTSYEFAAVKADEVRLVSWDLVVFDEAHRLRNVYRTGASRAKKLRESLTDPFKVLLTATPLQNNIMELFGLVSMIDDHVFGDEASFRTLYGGSRPDPAHLMLLRKRLEAVCRRTLRRTVQEAGHISYTKRLPTTFKLEPTPEEISLYEQVSEFLQRPNTVYLGGKPNALVTMSLRKILGSSSYAIGETLNRIAERLQSLEAITAEVMADDLDILDETAEEWNADDETEGGLAEASGPPPVTAAQIAAEVLELQSFRDLARSIQKDAKGERLASELPALLDTVVNEKRGKRKVVIFTESVRTQTYLADLLTERGFDGQIARLNGANNDPGSAAIYADWLARHRGTDKVSGSKTADMKAAIVEAFRDEKTILIATESGAEGINLQFCSLLVNYDLPWNPQRVEQRIGRCHRYGQKIDVTVVNFLNTKNRAEERIFELLNEKFGLFEGVFGASDEVLGIIESGVDFEKRVHQIVQTARTAEQIEIEFDALTESLKPQIDAEMRDARERCSPRSIRTSCSGSARGETTLSGSSPTSSIVFTCSRGPSCPMPSSTSTPTGAPASSTKERPGQRGGRSRTRWTGISSGSAMARLPIHSCARPRRAPCRDYDAYRRDGGGRMADIEAHLGQSGWMSVSKLALNSAGRTVEHLVVAARADHGGTPPELRGGTRELSATQECRVDAVMRQERHALFSG